MRLAVDILSAVLGFIVLYYYLNNIFRRKEIGKAVPVLAGGLFMLGTFAVVTFALQTVIAPILFFVCVFLYSFLYEAAMLKRCLYICLFYVLAILAEILVGIPVVALFNVSIEEAQNNVYIYALNLVLSKLLLIFLFRMLRFFKSDTNIKLGYKSVLPILLIEIAGLVSIYYFSIVAYRQDNIISSISVFIITVIVLSANIATFYLLESQIQFQKSKDTILNIQSQYKLQKEYYSELKENMLSANKNTHDVKNFAIALTALIDKGEPDAAKAKIEEFCGQIPASQTIHTGNAAVDALVQSKMQKIHDEIPGHAISIIIPDKLRMDEIDLCILLGNAIDNAVEACEKIPERNERSLTIKIFPYENQLSILVENSNAAAPKMKTPKFTTSKPDAFKHGFGIKSMKRIVEEHGGNIVFEQSDDVFIVSTLIPN